MGRIVWTALFAISALGVASFASAQVPAIQIITFHGLTFPPSIAGAERFSVRDYEKDSPGLGYSVGYRQPDAVTSVYIYDLRKRSIPDDVLAPLIAAEFESAQADMFHALQREGYSKIEPKDRFSISDAGKRTRLLCVAAVVDRFDQPNERRTYLCLGSWKNKFIKFRGTGGQLSEANVRLFLEAWMRLLWPS